MSNIFLSLHEMTTGILASQLQRKSPVLNVQVIKVNNTMDRWAWCYCINEERPVREVPQHLIVVILSYISHICEPCARLYSHKIFTPMRSWAHCTTGLKWIYWISLKLTANVLQIKKILYEVKTILWNWLIFNIYYQFYHDEYHLNDE